MLRDNDLKRKEMVSLGSWSSLGCHQSNSGRVGQKYWATVHNIPFGASWEEAADAQAASLIGTTIKNRKVFAAVRDIGAMAYVHAWTEDDGTCGAKPTNGWTDAGCGLGKTTKKPGHHYWTQLTIPGSMSWEETSQAYADDIVGETVEGKVVFEASWRTSELGAFVDVWTTSLSCDVTWDDAVSGCDGFGSNLTVHKCNGWLDNDPIACLNSQILPIGETKQWISCAIGSSPAGIVPGDSGVLCGKLSETFPCTVGGNCFAVTKQTTD
jgi:hypothetical protein